MTEKEQFSTGAMRDKKDDKVSYDLIPLWVLERFAIHLGHGAKKYEAWNHAKGMPIKRCYASLFRHLMGLLSRDRSEDHFAGVLFNLMVIEETLVGIESGRLPGELYDLEYDYLEDNPDFPTNFEKIGIK